MKKLKKLKRHSREKSKKEGQLKKYNEELKFDSDYT